MKRFLLGFGALLISAPLFAQTPVLNTGNLPALGTQFHYMTADTDEVTAGPGGENVTWDFYGTIFGNSETETVSYQEAEGTMYKADFPAANLLAITRYKLSQQLEFSIYNYYRTDQGKMEYLGLVQPAGHESFKFIYDKPMLHYPIPFQYGDSVGGRFNCSFKASGGTFQHKGVYSVKADGYGTLKFHDTAVFQNVLRLHTSIREVDSSGNLKYITNTERYTWLMPGHPTPILTIESVVTDLPGRQTGKTVMFNSTQVAVGVQDRDIPFEKIVLRSDANTLSVRLGEDIVPAFRSISLCDQNGKTIASAPCMQESSFDIGGLAHGMYFVRFEGEDFSMTRKFIRD